MNAAELMKAMERNREPRPPGTSLNAWRLEVMAAERDLTRFLAGKNPPSPLAAEKLAEITVRNRFSHEEVGTAFVADPNGFELGCRGPFERLKYRLSSALSRAFSS